MLLTKLIFTSNFIINEVINCEWWIQLINTPKQINPIPFLSQSQSITLAINHEICYEKVASLH